MTFDVTVFFDALTSPEYLWGAIIATSLAILAQGAAIVLGFFLALGRGSKHGILQVSTSIYVWIFRAIPVLLILIIIWNALPQLFPVLMQDWFTPYFAAFLGLTLLETALMAEILRSALSAIDPGQIHAARAIGLSPRKVYQYVLIPQMIRVAIPPTGNQFINMVKMTSLASVISLQELLYVAQQRVSLTFSYAEYYSAAAIYYLVIVSIFMIMQSKLEKKYTWVNKDKDKTMVRSSVDAEPTTGRGGAV